MRPSLATESSATRLTRDAHEAAFAKATSAMGDEHKSGDTFQHVLIACRLAFQECQTPDELAGAVRMGKTLLGQMERLDDGKRFSHAQKMALESFADTYLNTACEEVGVDNPASRPRNY